MILLWGSNARETHPIFFHHLLKGVHNGAWLAVVDPRRTSSAQWADRWLGLDVGSDVALSNTIAREIIHAGLHNRTFIDRATEGFDAYAESVEPFTLERGRPSSPGCRPRRSARSRTATRAPTARRSAGRSGSPSTTTRSTTCWR